MNNSFSQKEDCCEYNFRSSPSIYHCTSSENFQIILTAKQEYADVMLILGICCKLFACVHLLAFQIMSNHFHFVLSGDKSEIERFLDLFTKKLDKYIESRNRKLETDNLIFKFFPVDSLSYCRATIAYCNRNGFVVYDSVTPFSYPWGSNCCYFSPVDKKYYNECKKAVRGINIRSVFRGKMADAIKDLYELNEIVSPFSFCDSSTGEKMFRDARHYFYCVSKDVESYNKIAETISESISYTDDDIYLVTKKLSKEKYNELNPTLLPSNAKMDLATTLHYDYNASNKQIMRLLKIDTDLLTTMFKS